MTKLDHSKMLPGLLSGEELLGALRNVPVYRPEMREKGTAERLMALSDIYKVYLPSTMSVEIYNKLYIAAAMSLQKKGTRESVLQQGSNYRAMHGGEYRGIIGGADSFTVIGKSGIGKSSAIEQAIHLICGNEIIETERSYAKIIPCLMVQCPFDCASKGMLLEILRMVDIALDTKYYSRSQRAGVTTDILIGTVAQVAINHIGLLIIDEIQHVAGHKSGKILMGMLTQLINASGISICMVGTPECVPFFEQTAQLARRSMGLRYSSLPCDEYFREFCELIYGYQYVRTETEVSDAVIEWLYEHSAGVLSVVVSLIHDAQEIAIFSGREILDIQALNEAFMRRLTMLHGFVTPKGKTEMHRKPEKEKSVLIASTKEDIQSSSAYMTIPEMAHKAKDGRMDIVALLKEQLKVTEVSL